MPPPGVSRRRRLPGHDGQDGLQGLEGRVLQTNPILESFGNAMTTRRVRRPRLHARVRRRAAREGEGAS